MKLTSPEIAILLVSSLVTAVLEAATLFPYDSATSLTVIDDMAEPVTMTTPVYFHGNSYTQIYISENGMVTFEDGFYGGIIHPLSNTWIAPFGADVYPGLGEIKYQIFTSADATEMASATDFVEEIYPDDNFVAAEVFAVTWLNVKTSASGDVNTFQLAMSTDGTEKTYAIFLYEQIKWYPAEIGASAGDSASYFSICDTDKYGTTFLNIKSNSQCATKGAIVLRLDHTNWNERGYTCTPVFTAITCTGTPASRQCSAG